MSTSNAVAIRGRVFISAKAWLLVLIVGSALTGFSGCRSGAPSDMRTRVRIAVPSTPMTYLPIYLARDLGYYEEQRLDVTMDEVQGGPKALQAMFGGSVDVAAGFFELAIQMAAERHQVKSFLTILERPWFALVVSPASSRKISRIEDLRGAAVGVSTPGSASHQLVNYLLARHHVRLEDVSIVGIGLGPTAVAER